MKSTLYTLLFITAFPLLAGEIPSIYRCYGSYSLVLQMPPLNFCSSIDSIKKHEEIKELVESAIKKYDLTKLECNEKILKLIAPHFNRVVAESTDESIFLNLGKFEKFVNLDFYVGDSEVNLGAIAAICGYSKNLKKIIDIGGRPKGQFIVKVQTKSGELKRSFGLLEGLDFNQAANSNFQYMSLMEENETYDAVERLIKSIE